MRVQNLTMLAILIFGIGGGGVQLIDTGTINIVTIVTLIATIGYFLIGFIEEGFGMFNWFGRREYPSVPHISPLQVPKAYPPMPDVEEPAGSSDGYTVGMDNNNNTVVCIKYDYGNTTLTMNEHGVRQMIRLLEATLPKGRGK